MTTSPLNPLAGQSEEQAWAKVAELLHFPVAGILPDAAINSLCTAWLKKEGTVK